MPGAHAGVCVTDGTGAMVTIAGTDPLVSALDGLQADVGEGPSFTALGQGHTVIVSDVESEHRWPRFIPRAAGLGLWSQLGLPLSGDRGTLGVLNVYCTSHTFIDPQTLTCAIVLADQATLAMEQAVREVNLVAALASSRTIGKAIGVIMQRHHLDDDAAFQHLVRISQHTNAKLRDVAAELVGESNAAHRP
jgi:hypothetical protein